MTQSESPASELPRYLKEQANASEQTASLGKPIISASAMIAEVEKASLELA